MPRRKTFRRRVLTKRASEIAGLPKLIDQLNDLGEAVEDDDVYEVLMDGARELRDEARERAPYDSGPRARFRYFRGRAYPRDVHLRDAIFAAEGDPSKDKRGPTVLAGVDTRKAPHAALIERGTSKTPAHPFWRPAITKTRHVIAKIYADGLKKIIEQAVR